MLETLVKE
jgi:hypothetical protein